MSLAVANYHDQHGHYPAAYTVDAGGNPRTSWRLALLPYLEEGKLHDQYASDDRWDSPRNQHVLSQMPSYYVFHGEHHPGVTVTNYLAVVGGETAWPGAATLSRDDVTDGLSRTILIVENHGAAIQWLEPRDLLFDRMSFEIGSPAGLSSKYLDPAVAMLDGSTRQVGAEVTPEALRAVLTASGGENVQEMEGEWTVLADGRQREIAD